VEESIKLRPLREVAQAPETTSPWPPDPRAYRYEQLADHITAQIENGELTPWQQLPREADFAQKHGVSLGTARHAIALLRRRGLVVTVRSKGTYVTPVSAHARNKQEMETDTKEFA
jgi:GntR family transcriptional regulator